jgi:hypothetical protein
MSIIQWFEFIDNRIEIIIVKTNTIKYSFNNMVMPITDIRKELLGGESRVPETLGSTFDPNDGD